MSVLLVEDDLALGDTLGQGLRQAGVRTVWVRRAQEARAFLLAEPLDALVLDLALSDGEGLALLHELRARGSRLPVVALLAHDQTRPASGGADDYLSKPFALPDLLLRLQDARRRGGALAGGWQVGELCIGIDAPSVTLAGRAVDLSPSEYALLLELVRAGGKVVGREQLLACLGCGSGNALEVHVHNLRRKLGCGWVRTLRGVGYRLPAS
jgi:DNA-binding response OmpR family regulator